MENIIIRQENPKDHTCVERIVQRAFAHIDYSDQTEHLLVNRLRSSDAFVPELSMVAEINDTIVGHILLTRIKIIQGRRENPSLALAPISVCPSYQNKGIGSKLIIEAHKVAKSLEFHSIALIGHESYYPRFGYKTANTYNIHFPFDVPVENCMVIELTKDGLKGITGMIEYSKEFFK